MQPFSSRRNLTILPRMKYLIVIDSTANGRPGRSYLCRPRGSRGYGWFWTFEREEAHEFASRDEAQRIIKARMKLRSDVLIVPVSEDPREAAPAPVDQMFNAAD
jgi:hypothetical protein